MEARAQAPSSGHAGYPTPAARRLRVYAFDPLASTSLDTAVFNDAVVSLPWEEPWEAPLQPGPVGEYLEVVDVDPASGVFYAPVDPNDPLLLAQNGLPPSEGRPQFHQQMVYAVAMKTIRNFERALGRKVLWAPERPAPGRDWSTLVDDGYLQRLRIYPHAMREDNAYYSPQKRALLFGYFRAQPAVGGRSLPGGWVFTCLSHDVIAHETTHAILDGMHDRFIEPTTLDSLAFHEAFADIVALLQHFTLEGVVEHELAAQGGSLRMRTLLSGLARQFADARGMAGALREGLDKTPDEGDPQQGAYALEPEPHARGAFLVAAVFDAFVSIFERRSGDLLRIAGGMPAPGRQLGPELARRMAREAQKAADQMLRICVRALDYVPPVDLRFGEFLRAMITADADLVPDDPLRYRVAIAEAFRRRGVFPHAITSMAPDSLMWEDPTTRGPAPSECRFDFHSLKLDLEARFKRKDIWRQARKNQAKVNGWLGALAPQQIPAWEALLGVKLTASAPATIARSKLTGRPAVEVRSIRMARRAGPDGQDLRQLVIEVGQRRRAFFDATQQAAADAGAQGVDPTASDFVFRGGATLIVDLRSGEIRYAVRKRIDDDDACGAGNRLQQQRDYLSGAAASDLCALYFGAAASRAGAEPFAMLHRS